MTREWNTKIFLSFLFAAAMGVVNILGLTGYEPFNPILRNGTIVLTILGIITGPILTYFGVVRSKALLAAFGIVAPVLCAGPGLLFFLNGKNDMSAVQFYEATVNRKETGKVKNSTIYKLHVQLVKTAHHRVTIWTSAEKFNALKEGSVIGVPGKPGSLGIPWRVKGEAIRLVRY